MSVAANPSKSLLQTAVDFLNISLTLLSTDRAENDVHLLEAATFGFGK
jgi:hypothetical protein